MPRPKTACLDCGALCCDARCRPCFRLYMNLKQQVRKASESWWVGVPREQFGEKINEQKARWIEA